MSDDRVLNEFQISSRRRIESLVRRHGREVDFVTAGERETYLLGKIRDTGFNIWIYEDELEFMEGGTHVILERPDFDSDEDMQKYFFEALEHRMSTIDRLLINVPSERKS